MISTIIICIILAVVIVIGIRSTKKRATSGCCDTGDTVKRVKVKDKDKSHYPYQTTLNVSGMHCQNCTIRVENAFNGQDGFYARVNTSTQQVTILSKEEHSLDELIDIVRKSGYQATAA